MRYASRRRVQGSWARARAASRRRITGGASVKLKVPVAGSTIDQFIDYVAAMGWSYTLESDEQLRSDGRILFMNHRASLEDGEGRSVQTVERSPNLALWSAIMSMRRSRGMD